MTRILFFVDRLNASIGQAFGWVILILTFGVSYEVFVRYVLRDPTSWAYDVSYMMYGALFLMAGPYTLSRNGHVRGDVIYRLMPQRLQAGIDLVLYIIFLLPGCAALAWYGYTFAAQSVQFLEKSIFSPAGVPVYGMKVLIPVAGTLLVIQGFVEIARCIICLRDGAWPQRLHDVEEMESALQHYEEDHRRQEAVR